MKRLMVIATLGLVLGVAFACGGGGSKIPHHPRHPNPTTQAVIGHG